MEEVKLDDMMEERKGVSLDTFFSYSTLITMYVDEWLSAV